MSDPLDGVFGALADPTRRTVVRTLLAGPATATELARDLPISRQAVAKHLGTLADAGLVTSARNGRDVRFALTLDPLDDAAAWMAEVGEQWDGRLARLQRHVARRSR